jgi:hypothetical protein
MVPVFLLVESWSLVVNIPDCDMLEAILLAGATCYLYSCWLKVGASSFTSLMVMVTSAVLLVMSSFPTKKRHSLLKGLSHKTDILASGIRIGFIVYLEL